MKRRTICAMGCWLLLAAPAWADEIRLKDGTKIIGTIVGFEGNSFKVETSYGFALVRKDKIAAILPSEAKPEPNKEASAESKKPSSQATPVVPAVPAAAKAAQPAPAPPLALTPAVKKETSAPPRIVPAASTPAPAPPPPAEPAIREEVQGNLYINHTYGFRMYKPPGWHVIEGALTTLPSAIVAMGTGDETTLLIIGRERMKDSLEAHAAATERQLREAHENYRRISERRTRVAGLPALEQHYRGTVDGHDWSGIVLSFARGKDIFTILGTTYADSDLIQIQENVIAKAIASLQFTAP